MSLIANLVLAMLAAVPTSVAYLSLLGLGLHRHASPIAVAAASTLFVFGPAMAVAAASYRRRTRIFLLGQGAWALWICGQVLPVYFPGERRDALAAGIAVLGLGQFDGLARDLAGILPNEPDVARPSAQEAVALSAVAPPPPLILDTHQIALPYEGEGRTLSVPVVLRHGTTEIESWLMVDTGATYTALKPELLARLGADPGELDPVIQLHTANGERQARLVQLDRIWLGDIGVDAVAIATCDRCPSDESGGLLGLNVAGGFNVTIDADRREMVFSRRTDPDRVLDVKPFVDLDARFLRYPGGRVEVEVHLDNPRSRTVEGAVARIRCAAAEWSIPLGSTPPSGRVTATRRLPSHEPCETYEVDLGAARWATP